MSMSTILEEKEPTYDNLYLATVIDEALDYSNPNYNPAEGGGEEEKGSGYIEDTPSSQTEVKPSNTTMDGSITTPSGAVKTTLLGALESVETMDEEVETPTDKDEETHQNWEQEQRSRMMPNIPNSLGGDEHVDDNGLVYLEYTFTVDPSKYKSPNYMPINNTEGNDTQNRGKSTKESQGENDEEIEVSVDEKTAADAYPDKEVLDYASFIDGSSFICFDEWKSVDYSKIAMDAGAKKAPTRTTCKTTFSQCRAENPLFCRFHGPKLLEKDIKTNIVASLGKGCVVSVTKDKGQKNPLTFRLTIGCPPAKKKMVQDYIHKFFSFTPGLSLKEDYKDVGGDKMSTEFDMDILKADQPPKKTESKAQAAQWETEKAKAAGKKMAVVGETPPKVEKLANEGGVQKTDMLQPPVEEEVEEKVEEKVEQPTEQASGSEQGNIGEEENKAFSNLVDEATKKGLFNIEEFKKGYDTIYNDHTTYPTTASQIDALEKLIDETDWESKKPQPTEEEKDKKSYEDEFNAALMEYPEGGGGSDNDAKKIEINEAFTKAFIGNDAEGMKSAIGAMKKLVSDVKGEEGGEAKGDDIQDVLGVLSGLNHEIPDFNISYDAMGAKNPTDIKISAYGDGDFGAMLNKVDSILANVGYGVSGTNGNDMHIVKKGGSDAKKKAALAKVKEAPNGGSANGDKDGSAASANAPSGFHFVDDTAMKMTGEIDDLAHENPELISGDDNVSALYYMAQQAINGLDLYKQGLDEIDAKIKKYNEVADTAFDALTLISLTKAQAAQQAAYDEAKANAELSVKDFQEAVEKTKAHEVDSMKGTAADMVESIVKTTASAIFPNGKPDGVDSVEDMIDALDEEMTSLINNLFIVNGKVPHVDLSKVHSIEDKHSFGEKYKAVSSASKEFEEAITSFKDLIDGVKSKEGAESLKKAVDGISKYSQKLKDAFAAYKMAIARIKKEVSDWSEMKEKEKKLKQNDNEKPSWGEIYQFLSSAGLVSGETENSEMVKNAWMPSVLEGKDADGDPIPDTLVKVLKEKITNFPQNNKVVKTIQKWMNKMDVPAAPTGVQEDSGSDSHKASKDAIKAKIAAMSVKEKMEKSIPILEKKIKAEPDNEKWKKMLKQAKAYLAAQAADDDYLE